MTITLTESDLTILRFIGANPGVRGLAVRDHLNAGIHGWFAWLRRCSGPAFYSNMAALEDAGLVHSQVSDWYDSVADMAVRRWLYTLTARGKEIVDRHFGTTPVGEVPGE